MKKIAGILCAACLLLAVGCGRTDPQDTVESVTASKDTAPIEMETETETETETERQTEAAVLPEVIGSWMQSGISDPMMLILREDGSALYYASETRESEYTSTYTWEDGVLTLNMVNLDNSGVTEMVFQADFSDEQGSSMTLTQMDTGTDLSLLYGYDQLMPGTYDRLSFTDEELNTLKETLGVPEDAAVTFTQGDPEYWYAGSRWLINVEIYENGTYVAGGAYDPLTLEACRNIMQYSGS